MNKNNSYGGFPFKQFIEKYEWVKWENDSMLYSVDTYVLANSYLIER